MPVLHARAVRQRRTVNAGLTAAFAILLAACAATPPAPSLTAAADPNARVPAARYSSVTAPYTSQRPVEPQPWRERNQRVAPQTAQ